MKIPSNTHMCCMDSLQIFVVCSTRNDFIPISTAKH